MSTDNNYGEAGSTKFGTDDITSAILEQTGEAIKQGQEISGLLHDQTIASIKQGQALALESISNWSGLIGKFSAQFPEMPGIPAGAEFTKTVESAFDIAQELVKAQRELALAALKAVVPSAA